MVPVNDQVVPAEWLADATVREVVRVGLSAPRLRLRLSNAHGTAPLMIGAVTVARRIAARLREHDVRLRAPVRARRPTSGWGSLTPTELTVADLVGQGLTSPQIAAQLYLSPRTVQTHISHSLRKLNLRSRVALATTVARHRG